MKILITGATGSLGGKLAKAFKGHDLILHGRDLNKFPIVEGKKIIGDFRDQKVIEKIIKECQDVDVFINNAALFQYSLLEEVKHNEVVDIINVNVTSQIIILKKVVQIFKERGQGTILNMNSVAGIMGNKMEAIYCASKYGMKGFLDSVRYDCIQHGVKVIDVFSGAMNDGMATHKGKAEKFIDQTELADLIVILVQTKSFFSSRIDIHRAVYE
jgi:short-subunit dehydrogenase